MNTELTNEDIHNILLGVAGHYGSWCEAGTTHLDDVPWQATADERKKSLLATWYKVNAIKLARKEAAAWSANLLIGLSLLVACLLA